MSALKLAGKEKAAVLLIALGPETSANVLRHLRDGEIEQVTAQIFALEAVGDDVRRGVLLECFQMALASRFISSGGFEYAHEMLSRALGHDKAAAVINRLATSSPAPPFAFLRETDPGQLATFLQDEQPQVIALVLSYLPPGRGSRVLVQLPPQLQADVASRIATMEPTPPEVLERVERVLRRRLGDLLASDDAPAGGAAVLAKILANADRETERAVLEQLEQFSPELAATVREQVFTFDDLVGLEDRYVQRLLREVELRALGRALRGASEELAQKFFRNLSERAAGLLREEVDVAAALRPHQVEEARLAVVAVVRQLEAAGEIVIERGGDGDA